MHLGGRVTDQIEHFRRRGQLRNLVRTMRTRPPERLRWRNALATVTQVAGGLQGYHRMLVEEPVRELVLDLDDRILRRESALDARRSGVDLDRGEIFGRHTGWDLKRTAYLTGVDLKQLAQFVALPNDLSRPLDTAAVVLAGRSLANLHRCRAQRLFARVPIPDTGRPLMLHEQYLLDRAKYDSNVSRRWAALAKTFVQGSR